ncbi:LEA type 2 family protein [Parahaliea mediterranea]|uniref:LEA type 2 family protein n=1 Tax=Parahaliea mediterranea TaxID=651086 RepID=A0A939DHT9_9GAMM|nr:LEA type 2 family protein [Parahaliea mediterranea]MBN7798426.1 LEA type 2 family protein [Parahaliea mediterranea]
MARIPLLLCLAAMLSGCASLMADMDPPVVNVDSVRSLPAGDGGPRFEITLRIANPNKQALDIAGISYSVDILDHSLVSGLTNEVPRIEPYSEQSVTLRAGVNMLQLLRLLADLGRQRNEALDYRFAAKIDFKGLLPTQRVEESGSLTLSP